MALRRTLKYAGAAGLLTVTAASAYNNWDLTKLHFEAISGAGPLLRAVLDAENSHYVGILSARLGLFPVDRRAYPESLKTEVWGKQFPNPLGVAAGFDKDAEALPALYKLGFGFVEVGSITPLPQAGNAKPRVFRLPELECVINRCGFNSKGSDVARKNLMHFLEHQRPKLPESLRGPLAVNLGKNKESEDAAADYETGIAKLGEFGDFVVVNVSSPNTPGLRSLQGKEALEQLLSRVLKQRDQQPWASSSSRLPVLVKIAPDLSEQDKQDIADVVLRLGIDGLVVSNTTIQRPEAVANHRNGQEAGGLSGRALRDISTEAVREMYSKTGGKVPIIGVGGISSGEDAYEKIRAGASLVQLYTSFAFQGPAVVPRIKEELAECLARDGFASVAEAVGADHRPKGL
uniref:Dihydroorotate dehydrogenase (quinone), mitochondrial n=1 Tax=Tetraselmis sp. GSL018 TaxID=582737 RepID=A0A061RMG2_9CHLO|mmetsp:Transcript_20918/g.49896  ORF Transcript_20918/g.49896 Transcript_20918/m.49896 type:complete len:404 (+) Transcript_20918:147-1358(+)|eukprot:CAMPEP_0177616436 /NCGR_PEP_ID=MMETSP0419_2-20121207/24155_1 /TAXON_ID=582737 /ORGANISM="Tetraselmis sp., Strain GSL018" /LENGTH=403 /DNA_ID=CAMNT_0019114495 /DNA_START=365 /DNA_END=1576 /DNA_ORIENTATION=+